MKKVINYCKRKYKTLIPIMVVFALLVAIFFLYKEYKYDNYRNKKEVAVYQCTGGIKNEYTAVITYNLKNAIVNIAAKDSKIEYDSTPIYYQEEDKIIFPKEMNITFPLRGGSQYKLYGYSIYEKNTTENIITTGYNTDKYEYFFLYDGKGLYFFPDEVTLNINGKAYKTMSKMSYVNIVGGYTMTYYDKETDTTEFLEIEGKEITVSSDKINVNLTDGYCLSLGNMVLLMEPSNLNAVK